MNIMLRLSIIQIQINVSAGRMRWIAPSTRSEIRIVRSVGNQFAGLSDDASGVPNMDSRREPREVAAVL
jgi:hypothetical protein